MKAIIAEIHKDYCIAVTRDGQFLKEKIPEGSYEIGDEIIIGQPRIEKTVAQTRLFRILSRTAIGFAAVIVIVTGSYFGVQYIRSQALPTEIAMAAKEEAAVPRSAAEEEAAGLYEAEADTGEAAAGETIAEDEALEESVSAEEAVAFEDAADTIETALQSLEEIFSGTYSLEKMDTELIIENEVLFISYRVDEMEEKVDVVTSEEQLKELTLKFKNIKENSFFDGNVDILMLHSDMSVSEIEKILFADLDYNQQDTKKIPFLEETNFKLIVFGLFR